MEGVRLGWGMFVQPPQKGAALVAQNEGSPDSPPLPL